LVQYTYEKNKHNDEKQQKHQTGYQAGHQAGHQAGAYAMEALRLIVVT
jgi:flagellar biosynthesis/type III secretory pathway protein FliH